jgi:hypothetical protein
VPDNLPTFFGLPWKDGGVREQEPGWPSTLHDYYTDDGAKLCHETSSDSTIDHWWFTPGRRPDGTKPFMIWNASDSTPVLPDA